MAFEQRVKQLKQGISELKKFNDQHAPKEDRDSGRRALDRASTELLNIEDALTVPSALGVFGQSQCGKSYLVSELIGGKDQKVLIRDVEDKGFQDYNQLNADTESTAVVTRFTSRASVDSAPEKSVKVKFLSPTEVMWSFTWGFYTELNPSGFEMEDERKDEIREEILSTDNSSKSVSDVDHVIREFGECISWIKGLKGSVPELSEIAYHHLSKEPLNNLSLDRFVLIASTLWNNDENITNCFRARIETLDLYNYPSSGYLPEELLKDVLDAKKLNSLSLSFNVENVFSFRNNAIIYDEEEDNLDLMLQNLQAIIKEVILIMEESDQCILPKLDVLDFPGARALAGTIGADSAEEIKKNVSDGNSEILAGAYKRGKLLFLFDIYCKNFDVSILLLCSAQGPQEAKPIKKMVENWIDKNLRHDAHAEKGIESSLFVALTKSDLLMKASDTNLTDADNRITNRFRENFAKFYGSWVENFLREDDPFKNFYLVRNPQADQNCFVTDEKTKEEKWRSDFTEKKLSGFKKTFLKNSEVSKYLSGNKEKLYEGVFNPGRTGIDYLMEKIIDRHNEDPDLKKRVLNHALSSISSDLYKYRGKYYQGENEEEAKEIQREKAREFITSLRNIEKSVSILLNSINKICPGEKLLYQLVNEAVEVKVGAMLPSIHPIKDGINEFIISWFKACRESKEFHSKVGVQKDQITEYIEQIESLLTSEHVKTNELKNIDQFFNPEPSSIRSLRNYILWIAGRKMFYLGATEINGMPEGPITIEDDIEKKIQNNILDLWEDKLPEIYAGNFSLREPPSGTDILKNLNLPGK